MRLRSLLILGSTIWLTACTSMRNDATVSDHRAVSYNHQRIEITVQDRRHYHYKDYKLYLDSEYLMSADRSHRFDLRDKKLRWKLYEHYKKNQNICFRIVNARKGFSIVNDGKCFRNLDLEKKFSIDYAHYLKKQKAQQSINQKQRALKTLALEKSHALRGVEDNPYFNSRTQSCEKPYIKPISNLCDATQNELDRLYIDCLRPVASKVCKQIAKEGINDSQMSYDEKRRMKLVSSTLCSVGVGGKITGADIADELGDEFTDSDNILVSSFGYLLETSAVIATTANVASCLDQFNMNCDVQGNNDKEQTFSQCQLSEKPFKKLSEKHSLLSKEVRQAKGKYIPYSQKFRSKNYKNVSFRLVFDNV